MCFRFKLCGNLKIQTILKYGIFNLSIQTTLRLVRLYKSINQKMFPLYDPRYIMELLGQSSGGAIKPSTKYGSFKTLYKYYLILLVMSS